jgi:RNA polymerase sigma factor (sigma-70 family)
VHNVDDVDLRLDLSRACARLTERQRAALVLVVGGLSQAEAAEQLGIGQPAVSYRLTRARERLTRETS